MNYKGKHAHYAPTRDLYFTVKILDSKMAYGRTLVYISPLNGTGEKWVDLNSVTVLDKI